MELGLWGWEAGRVSITQFLSRERLGGTTLREAVTSHTAGQYKLRNLLAFYKYN